MDTAAAAVVAVGNSAAGAVDTAVVDTAAAAAAAGSSAAEAADLAAVDGKLAAVADTAEAVDTAAAAAAEVRRYSLCLARYRKSRYREIASFRSHGDRRKRIIGESQRSPGAGREREHG